MKRYWTTFEVSEMLGMTQTAVRFWVKQLGLDTKKKNKGTSRAMRISADGVRSLERISQDRNIKSMDLQNIVCE